MRAKWSYILGFLAVSGCLLGQQAKPVTSAKGMFLSRSKGPMTGARLMLCQAVVDPARHQGKIVPLRDVPVATVDPLGKFSFRGFAPGRYTIIYTLPGVTVTIPNEFDVSALDTSAKSRTPLLVKTELGADRPFEPELWGPFTLLKGHTFWSLGPTMKIWNATARRGPRGPYLELRRGVIWQENFQDKSDIRFEAWGF